MRKAYALSPARIRVITGLETWFTLPSKKQIVPPARYKMATITLLALFPAIQLANLTLVPLLELLPLPLPLLLQNLIVTAILVLLMTYVLMPRMSKLFSQWLYPKKR